MQQFFRPITQFLYIINEITTVLSDPISNLSILLCIHFLRDYTPKGERLTYQMLSS